MASNGDGGLGKRKAEEASRPDTAVGPRGPTDARLVKVRSELAAALTPPFAAEPWTALALAQGGAFGQITDTGLSDATLARRAQHRWLRRRPSASPLAPPRACNRTFTLLRPLRATPELGV
jgi:hypothetical protein